VQIKNVQAQKTVKPVKIVSTANTVLKMEEVVESVNDKTNVYINQKIL
jgi:hypothetical protein